MRAFKVGRPRLSRFLNETIRQELVEEERIRYVGVSELGIANLRKAHAVHLIAAYQMEWSLFAIDVEAELVPTCRELGIGTPIGHSVPILTILCSAVQVSVKSRALKRCGDVTGADVTRNRVEFLDVNAVT